MSTEQAFPWRKVVVSAFLPTILFSIGEGAIIPIIPVVASQLGATLAVAGLISAMLLVGELVGDIPSGALVARIGERPAMIGAAGLSILGVFTAILAHNPWVLGVGIFVIGLATAVFALARHAFMTSYVPIPSRARALSTLGGTFRFGYLVGPFLTAGIIQVTGSAANAFWIHLICCIAAGIVLVVVRDPAADLEGHPSSPHGQLTGEIEVAAESRGLFATIAAQRKVLLTVGVGTSLVAALRASRAVILPLWAVSIGIPEAQTAVIIGIAGAVDFALFYAGGQIMDRFGRLWSVVPSMIGLGIGHLLLAFTHDLADADTWFIVAAMVLALSNGIGAGILMTLGADLADPLHPAPFLGAWRFTNDAGGAIAPLLVAGITAAVSISLAAGVMGVLGFVGAGMLRYFLPKYSKHP